MIFSIFNFVHLPQYNIVLKTRYHKVETIPKTLCFGERVLSSCISRFIHTSKPVSQKYSNHFKMHKFENLVLIAEGEKKIQRNRCVSNVYKFTNADFESVEFYTARKYIHLKKEGIEKDFFVSDEDEEDNEVLPVSELFLFIEQRVG